MLRLSSSFILRVFREICLSKAMHLHIIACKNNGDESSNYNLLDKNIDTAGECLENKRSFNFLSIACFICHLSRVKINIICPLVNSPAYETFNKGNA